MKIMATGEVRQAHGFRGLRVVEKVRESRTITSFHLEPVDSHGWKDFQAGQYLVFKIPVPEERGFVLRNYSVSCPPGWQDRYRITVKREAAPTSGLPQGVGSSHLHDVVEVGDVLMAEGPRGEFLLDQSSRRPVALISGGVGLTPLISMLHVLSCDTDRRVYFIHACDSGEVHALRDEVRDVAASRPGIIVHDCYRHPSEVDLTSGRAESHGVITAETLQCLLPLDDYDFYLCGPPPFMQSVYRILRGLGVPKHRIAYEFFGPACVLEAEVAAEAAAPPAASPARATAGAITVEFRKSGRRAAWDATAGSLLDFAESLGLAPDFSCRSGICSTCRSRLLDGEVEYFEEPLDEPGAGKVLLCCARPTRSVVIDI